MSAYSPHVGRRFVVALVAFAALVAAPWEKTFAESVAFKQTALVSDGADKSAITN